MKKLKIDCGVESYRLGDFGVVRFNPADPGLFRRFLTAHEKVAELEQEIQQALQREGGDPADALQILDKADQSIKSLLSWVFGDANDFREIFKGVNLLTPDPNGEPILTQIMAVLMGPVKAGVDRWAGQQVVQAREKAAHRRAVQ